MTEAKKTIRSLFGLIFLDQTYLTITFPLITLIFFDPQSRLFPVDVPYSTRSLWYGTCVALPNVINIFFAPLLSALSDVFGRRKILLTEIFSAFLFTLLLGLGVYWGSLALLFLGFIIKGAFARINPTALAIIGDTVPKEKKILFMGYLQFAISVGASIGPVLGGYFAMRFFFDKLNFSLPFFIGSVLALINTGAAFFLIRATIRKKPAHLRINFHAIKTVVANRDVLRISLVLLLIQVSWSTYYLFMPPILKTLYAFDSHQLGWFIGMIAFWLAIATSIGLPMLHRFLNVRQILLVAIYLVFFGLIITLCALSNVIPAGSHVVWLGALPVAAGDVIAYSCLTALYSNVVAHEQQGKVMGIALFVVASVWAMTGFLGGILMGISPLLPLTLAPISLIIALTLVYADFGKKFVLVYNAETV